MSYCLNPNCKKPQNPARAKECSSCSSNLLLLDRYRAIRPIGEGTFGRSFLAEDAEQTNTACVIKQFLPLPQIQGNSGAMAKMTQMFEQEAKQLVDLGEQYPQIATLLTYVEEDKRLYVVRQYIEGMNLFQELQEQGAYNEHQVKELLYDILPVLQLVHNRQIIHREIKPTNIIRRNSDRKFVLIDFGISKQLTDTKLQRTSARIGNQAHIPLEMLRGGKVYPASDFYSLAIICIQLLTGAQLEDLYNPMEGRWVWREYFRETGRDVSDQLSSILDKMLKDAIDDRYQLASEILKDFYDSASRTVIRTTTAPPPPRVTPELQQKTLGWRCVQTLSKHADTVTSVAFNRDGTTLASGSADRSINIWEWETGKLIHKLNGHTDTITSVVFSPDGKILASGSADKTLKIWQADTGKLIYSISGHSVTVFSVAFSPDGQMLASGSGDGTIKLWHTVTGKMLDVLTGHSDFVESVAFSRDGSFLASGSWDNTIKIWNIGSRKLLHSLTGHSGSVWSIALSPDAKTFASNSGDNSIKIWYMATGQLVRTLTTNSGSAWTIAYSPDGQTIASDSGDNTIKIWHTASGQLLRTLGGHSDQVRSVAFSPQGRTIASGSDDMTVKIWRFE
ncbi:protein kinase [Aerosakkonema sp. BLCC-F183]|uniref:WD40 domain-containing protein n=1 Tax=Aerosakkonema sp. BLCC-F183 TaxID=3342834 RepID=UPI0035B83DE5